MEIHYRVHTYRNAGELEIALNQEAKADWKPRHLCSAPDGILVVYTSNSPAAEVAAWDHAAHVAEEANLTHEFHDPREED